MIKRMLFFAGARNTETTDRNLILNRFSMAADSNKRLCESAHSDLMTVNDLGRHTGCSQRFGCWRLSLIPILIIELSITHNVLLFS